VVLPVRIFLLFAGPIFMAVLRKSSAPCFGRAARQLESRAMTQPWTHIPRPISDPMELQDC
jgi:hypothetical protein